MERKNLKATIGACNMENFCDVILSSEANWNNITHYAEALLKSKEFELNERSRINV